MSAGEFSPASVRAAALEEERIDWIANANCPGGVAYPFNVKCAIRQAIAEADTALSVAPISTPDDQQLAQRIEEWIGKHGGENTATLLLYEAMKALKKPTLSAAPAGGMGEVDVESLIPDGWLLSSVDASMKAHGKSETISVMLVKDKAGRDAYHALSEEEQETALLYWCGHGYTIRDAIIIAAQAIAAAQGEGK